MFPRLSRELFNAVRLELTGQLFPLSIIYRRIRNTYCVDKKATASSITMKSVCSVIKAKEKKRKKKAEGKKNRFAARVEFVGREFKLDDEFAWVRDALLCVHVCDSSIRRGRNMT